MAVVAEALGALGYTAIAERLRERAEGATVSVAVEGTSLVVRAPYSEVFNRLRREIPRAYFSRERKATVVPVKCRTLLWECLCRAFPGAVIKGPMGARVATRAARLAV